jgi:NitT/TauT family transport system ATP-binding protein
VKLQVRNLSKKFKSTGSNNAEYVIAIENIDLTISDGEFVSIVGPSGCGKSTLLNILAGLDKPTEGEIILNGHEIDGTGPDRIMVFQENALFPWLKVIENVEFGLKIAGLQKDKGVK